jgi:pyruvate/2-oxoglutarate/acetoin dehydrogenase E1 component
VPEVDYTVPFGRADIKRKGRDVTVIATSYVVHAALAAAETLTGEGIDVEVLDPRTLVPLDQDMILDSVGRTGRLVVADETNLNCGIASGLSAIVAEHGFKSLRAPIARVARLDIPTPFSLPLEQAITPTAERICEAARKTVAWS